MQFRPRTKTLLAWCGALSILGACGFTVLGLATVKDRLDITIAEGADAGAVDPAQLLRDDVAMLRQDFETFGSALGSGLDELAQHLDENGRTQTAALESHLATLEERLARLTEREAELSGRVEGLAAAFAETPGRSGPPNLDPTHLRPAEIATDDDPPVDGSRNELARADVTTPSARPARPAASAAEGGFLGFRLPTGAFRFGESQRFQVLGSLSRVGFDAKSTLHVFTGAASGVTGEFTMALGDPAAGCHGSVEVDVALLKTGVEKRDSTMLEHLGATAHPTIRFDLTSIEPDAIDARAMTVTGTAVGTLTIAGNARDVRVPVQLSVDDGRRVVIEGEWTLTMSEYGVTPPSQLGMIEVEDEVRAWLSLRARSVGTAAAVAGGTH